MRASCLTPQPHPAGIRWPRMPALLLLLLVLSTPALAQVPAAAAHYRARLTREVRATWGFSQPVSIFAAQIHQESGWRPEARSQVGAEGLGQFMPGTARWISQTYPAELGAAAPYDAAWSLRALVLYDRWLWNRLGPEGSGFREDGLHRWAATLSSYNGGLGHLQKEQARAGSCDRSRYFCCVQSACGAGGRAEWACRENTQYPVRILLVIEPRYQAAGW